MGRVAAGDHDSAIFQGFGRSAFSPYRARLQSLAVVGDFTEVRRAMRTDCPPRPGVYGVVDDSERLVYVGMSISLRKRLPSYFQGGSALRKERCIAANAKRLLWETLGNEFTAQLRELELIRRHQPRFNVKGRQPVRPPGYIYLSREAAPRFRVSRRVPRVVRHNWGPLPIGWRIREAVELVNRLFKLCDCPASVPMHFADQQQLFSLELRLQCLRGETGSCLGPCAGACTMTQYAAQVRAARAFFDGADDTLLKELEQQLQDATRLQQYERAARLRDWVERLGFLWEQLAILREPPLPERFVYPLRVGRRPIWYLIAGGMAVAAAPAPDSGGRARRCLQLINRVFDADSRKSFEADRPAAQIVSAWFRAHPAELNSALSPVEASEMCRRLQAS